MEGCRCFRCCCSKLFISCLSLSRLSVVVVVIIIASAVNLLQMTVVSLPVSKSLRIETSGVGRAVYETRAKERPGRYLSHHYQTVVSSLEAVGVLNNDANQSNCFVLENLTKTWRPGIDGVSMVEVSLQLRQFQVPVGVRGRERGERRSKWSDDNKAAVHETDNACLEWLTRTTTIITSTPTTTTTTTTKAGGDDDERRKGDLQEEDEASSSASSGSGSGSGSGPGRNKSTFAGEEPKAKEKPKQEEHTGLNKRQILVISTCSTVIGAFFVTAFILRIRNYMKRSKQDKDGTKRHSNIRAASMPHQRTHHGSLDHFANNENHRRWSHFNPFATDR